MKELQNWWYYYKWYVIGGIALLGTVFYLIGNAFGLFEKQPDFQIAYVADSQLPQDTVTSLEQAFAATAWDFNGDGEVIVKLHQYVMNGQSQDAESLYYGYASEISVISDINDCESYFFLMDKPDKFQKDFQVLALPDGSCPKELDFSIEDKAFLWDDCPALATMELGGYSTTILGEQVTGKNQELLSGLYLGRRCFYMEDTVANLEQCSKLWDFLIAK